MKTIKNILSNFKRYSFLMQQLVSRDFKVKYKRSILGILWSLLYPVLMMIVMAIVFSTMFKTRIEGVNYLVYLMTGLVMFNFFNEASNSAMTSVVTNFTLMTKVYIPKYIFPISKCLFVGVNFLLTLIPLLAVILFTGSGATKCHINIYYLLLPYVFLCMFLFTVGLGLLLSTISVFLRDMFYIYGILLTIWQYFTPIFYDISMLPEKLQDVFKLNPMYLYITSAREIILFGRMPSTFLLVSSTLSALVMLFLGIHFFRKKQDEFIYHI